MSQVRDLLVSSARTIFETTVTKEVIDGVEGGRFAQRVWEAIDDAGLDLALVPEDRGGAGISFADAAAILRVAGAAAAPVPLADSLIARRLLAECGLEADAGPLALAASDPARDGPGVGMVRVERGGKGFRLDGELYGVPFARFATAIVLEVESSSGTRLAVVPRDRAEIDQHTGLAGEPRDRVRFTGAALEPEWVSDPGAAPSTDRLHCLGAFSRAALMSGALERILEMTVDYARERIQFGRPIGQFQAVQQELAVLAGEVAAAQTAADAAAVALDRSDPSDELAVAVAKVRVGEAAGRAAMIAHQVHGAIGFTHEHELHYRTRRLWAWRDEYGSETFWAERVGAAVLAAGSAGLWPLLTGTSARIASARRASTSA
ncbi:MAG TPA: acyl-CoA dehydrogenase family protein [Thermoanaerobaculia bacterium]|nr:acyl-CoA dehydrogenase family protein [Thermoanaerobaculia bacterium]